MDNLCSESVILGNFRHIVSSPRLLLLYLLLCKNQKDYNAQVLIILQN